MDQELLFTVGEKKATLKAGEGPIAAIYRNGTGLDLHAFNQDRAGLGLIDSVVGRVYLCEVKVEEGTVVLRNPHEREYVTATITGADGLQWARTILPTEQVKVPQGRPIRILSQNQSVELEQIFVVGDANDTTIPPLQEAPKKTPLESLLEPYDPRFRGFVNTLIVSLPYGSAEGYRSAYFADKRDVNAQEARVLRENPKLPRTLLADFLVRLHTQMELDRYTILDEQSLSVDSAQVLMGVADLRQGDFLPGGSFVLGRPEKYDRELLQISRRSPLVQNALMEAKIFSARPELALHRVLSQAIFDEFQEKYSDEQDGDVIRGVVETIGDFMETGGCCRHRSAALALTFQEAGINARYIRGFMAGRPHAWVHTYEGGMPVKLFDPNIKWDKKQAKRGSVEDIPQKALRKDKEGMWDFGHVYRWPETENVVWRAKPK